MRSRLSGSSTAELALKMESILSIAMPTICSVINAAESCCARPASSLARRSRRRAIVASKRNWAANCPITKATTSIRAKVKTYWVSLTVKANLGGTKKKSSPSTDSMAASAPGPRP